MLTDPVSDFLIRIKNGYLAKKSQVRVKFSKINEDLAKILVEEGYLEKLKVNPPTGGEKLKAIELTLKYDGKKAVLTDIQRMSKPGLRFYLKNKRIPKVLGGLGTIIISTSKGLMTGKEAKEKNLGGEAICKVW